MPFMATGYTPGIMTVQAGRQSGVMKAEGQAAGQQQRTQAELAAADWCVWGVVAVNGSLGVGLGMAMCGTLECVRCVAGGLLSALLQPLEHCKAVCGHCRFACERHYRDD